MSVNFNTFIDHIDAGFWRELCLSRGELRAYGKGEPFVKQGTVARYIGYIKSGTMKYVVYGTEGAEHVIGMEFEGEFVADFPFCLRDMKSRVSIIAASDCEIACLPVSELKQLMDENPGVKDRIMTSTEAIYSTLYDRYIALYSRSPLERYNELLSQHPDLFALFPLKDIASFLNITPTHLSRLRKNIY